MSRSAHSFGFTSFMTDSLLPVVVGLITAQNILGTIFSFGAHFELFFVTLFIQMVSFCK